MAVTTLPRALAGARSMGGLHPLVLLACLAAPGLDLLGVIQVQSQAVLATLSLVASLAAAVLLLVIFARQVREAWLAAAALAMLASCALRVVGASGPEAAILSLLGVLALGLGGAFASPVPDLDLSSADV